jgi:hypothetical protein
LTDGLSLLEGMGVRAGISMGMEAYRQALNGVEAGCIKMNGAEIAAAGLGSVLGDSIGSLDASQVADQLGEGTHWNPPPADMRSTVVEGNVGGMTSAPFSAMDGANSNQ